MPAASNRQDLLNVTSKEYDKLAKLLEPIPDDLALRPFEDGITIKDVIGHRAHWCGLFFGWYQDGQAGNDPHIPAKGYKWNQLKDYNAKLRANQKDLSYPEVRTMLDRAHTELLAFISAKSDDELYGAPMKGGGSKWTTGRWAEAAGASHYRSAAKFVRACVREAKKPNPAVPPLKTAQKHPD